MPYCPPAQSRVLRTVPQFESFRFQKTGSMGLRFTFYSIASESSGLQETSFSSTFGSTLHRSDWLMDVLRDGAVTDGLPARTQASCASMHSMLIME